MALFNKRGNTDFIPDDVYCSYMHASKFKCLKVANVVGVICRFIESHWFVWVTQMNHIPMEIDYEKHDDWLSMQVKCWLSILDQ